ncbi:MAG: DUF1844 domain-containing protein [Desulfobacteria bacterium]
MEEKEEKGFVVKDKRIFSGESEGSKQETVEKPAENASLKEEPPKEEPPKEEPPKERARTQLPEVNFSTFVLSLSSSVLVHLGEMADPNTGAPKKDLAMAKQTIDILGMFEEKTRGNLNPDEENLLANILYDIRMRYIKEK